MSGFENWQRSTHSSAVLCVDAAKVMYVEYGHMIIKTKAQSVDTLTKDPSFRQCSLHRDISAT